MHESSVTSLVPIIILTIIIIFPVWKILFKAGLNPALSLFIFLPVIGPLIVTLMLAFADWPAVRKNMDK